MNAAVRAAIGERAGAAVADAAAVGGGCISEARIVQLADGRSLFVKTNRAELAEMFEREAEGLVALEEARALRVPSGAWADVAGAEAFVVMEAIETGPAGPRFWERFGEGFARLHREATAERFGFAHDNFIGSTPQPNGWTDGWTDFWRERRLRFQLELARRKGRSTAELDRLGDRLGERLGEWLDAIDEPASLLHGDLWSGNFLVDSDGEPVLIDPACYHGHREADLAMTRLFGGFDRRFYAAYEAAWPLAAGSAERSAIYELYHLLNHVNLFGGAYLAGCLERLRRLVG